MKRKLWRFISVFLCLAMTVSLLSVPAFAEGDEYISVYDEEDNLLQLVDYGAEVTLEPVIDMSEGLSDPLYEWYEYDYELEEYTLVSEGEASYSFYVYGDMQLYIEVTAEDGEGNVYSDRLDYEITAMDDIPVEEDYHGFISMGYSQADEYDISVSVESDGEPVTYAEFSSEYPYAYADFEAQLGQSFTFTVEGVPEGYQPDLYSEMYFVYGGEEDEQCWTLYADRSGGFFTPGEPFVFDIELFGIPDGELHSFLVNVNIVPWDNHFEADYSSVVSVAPGSSVTFSVDVSADDTSNVTYQWVEWVYYPDLQGGMYAPADIEGATGASYTTPVFTGDEPQESLRYRCEISDGYGYTQNDPYWADFYLYIDNGFNLRPVDYKSNVSVRPGAGVTLQAEAAGANLNGMTWTGWYEVDDSVWPAVKTEIPNTASDSLTLQNVVMRKTYACSAQDRYGNTAECWFYVYVDNGFSIAADESSVPMVAQAGDSAYLKVSASAYDADGVTYQWFDNSGEPVEGAAGDSLTVENVTDYGWYYCGAYDKYGNYDSVYFEVGVENNLSVENLSGRFLRVSAGEDAVLQVRVAADDMSDLAVYWSSDSGEGEAEILPDATGLSSYTVENVTGRTAVNCTVIDRYGNNVVIYYVITVDSGLEVSYGAAGDRIKVPLGGSVTLAPVVTVNDGVSVYYNWEGFGDQKYCDAASVELTDIRERIEVWCWISDEYGNEKRITYIIEVENGLTASAVGDTEIYLAEGESALLQVTAEADEGDVSYQWFIEHVEQWEHDFPEEDFNHTWLEEIDGAVDPSYRVVGDGTDKTIVCVASDIYYGEAEVRFEIFAGDEPVYELPAIGFYSAIPEEPVDYYNYYLEQWDYDDQYPTVYIVPYGGGYITEAVETSDYEAEIEVLYNANAVAVTIGVMPDSGLLEFTVSGYGPDQTTFTQTVSIPIVGETPEPEPIVYEVSSQRELVAALSSNEPVDVIVLADDFTVDTDCTVKLDPQHIDNYGNVMMVVPKGVTITVEGSGALGVAWFTFEGDWDEVMPEAAFCNYGTINVSNSGQNCGIVGDFAENAGIVNALSGGEVVMPSFNAGSIRVYNGGALRTTQGDYCENYGTVTVDEGGVIEARFGSTIENCAAPAEGGAAGQIVLNGLFRVGSVRTDGDDVVWFYNYGAISGSGTIVVLDSGETGVDLDSLAEEIRGMIGNNNSITVMAEGEEPEPTPLQIVTQPENVTATVGDTVYFTVAAAGDGLTYQWQYSESGSTKWYNSPAEGNKTATLTVPATEDRSGNKYRCKVFDSHGSALTSGAATLTVTEPAVFAITAQPENVTATVGDTAYFTVTAAGDGLTYQWQYSDNGGTKWYNSPAEGNKTATLTVPATQDRNGLKYRCKVSDSHSSTLISDAATLTVTEPVVFEITAQPENVTANVGDTVHFTVTATGDGLTYQWQYSNNGGTTWNNSPAEGNKTATLTVPATQDRNGLKYRCKVTDSHGSTLTSDAATLTVTNPVVFAITAHPENVTANVGDTVHFTVTATGDGLTYQWQYSDNGGTKWYNSPAEGNKTATLTVPATEDRNGLKYRCKVSDSHGSVLTSDAATLTVTNPVVFAITAHPENVTANVGDTVHFTVAATGDGLTYQWQYSSSGSTKWYNSPAEGNKTATLTVPATEDRSGNKYRCKVTDSHSSTLISDAATLTVSGQAVFAITAQPENVTAAVGDTVHFTVAATGDGLTYQWQYSESGSTKWYNSPAEGNKTATLTVPATEDRSGNRYRCKVFDSHGNALTSSAATLTVNGQAVFAITAQPENVTAAVGDTVHFTVTATGDGLTYQWQYSSSGSTKWYNSPAEGNKTATLTVPATQDRSGNRYRCKVFDSHGSALTSSAATLTVTEAAVFAITAQPENVTANVGDTAHFTVAASGDGLKYQWQFSDDGGAKWYNSPAEGNKTATLTVPATQDRSGNKYRCKVTDSNGSKLTSDAAVLTVIP